ncbi:MAG: phospho-N-acetylmuramoyl-pentapeptide-transferase [Candidatus Gracilibacteria bacterium]|jgi:phospho-N-acetylmuramoyl-pentapeptide-transferase|nr:phospho-N-acetylmuramoyl-pentapeptide-transferase [Candidatus Gracilibacteria bacterium]
MQDALQNTIEKISLIAGSGTLAFIIAMIIAPKFIYLLQKYKIGKKLRENALTGEKSTIFNEMHAKKAGTPTMGGLLVWITVLIVLALSKIAAVTGLIDRSLINRKETYIVIFTMLSFGILGAIDDYLNVLNMGKTKGLNAKIKLIAIILLSFLGGAWFYFKLGFTTIAIPIPGFDAISVGWLYIPIFMVVIIATANAVNFTDGLDGLAAGLLIMSYTSIAILSYAQGLFILSAFCAIIIGSTLAFLWFNIPPAKFFMGDIGAIGLGATLGVTAMLTEQTLVLPIIGIIFVIEALSVIIQITSKKLFKRKVFLIAPIHHHFERKGWEEYKVVMRFWIVGGIFTVFGTILGLINLL